MHEIHEDKQRCRQTMKMRTLLTQGGSMYDITVGTVVNIDIHSMMLFHLHTARDRQEIQSKSRVTVP